MHTFVVEEEENAKAEEKTPKDASEVFKTIIGKINVNACDKECSESVLVEW